MKKRVLLFILLALASLGPLACQKTYLVGPRAVATSTPTATTPPAIQWPGAQISWNNNGGFGPFSPPAQTAQLNLQLNNSPDPAAGVTLSGNGVGGSLPLTYAGPSTVSGLVCSLFQNNITYTPGDTYILTSVTSSGTAAATLVAPGGVTVAPDYSYLAWPYQGNNLDLAEVFEVISTPPYCPGGTLFLDTPNAVSPVTLTSGYNNSCYSNYLLEATIQSATTVISGLSAPATFFASQYWVGTNP